MRDTLTGPLMPLEILHRSFVALGGGARLECAKIAPLAGLWIDLARVQTVFAALQFPDHRRLRTRRLEHRRRSSVVKRRTPRAVARNTPFKSCDCHMPNAAAPGAGAAGTRDRRVRSGA